MENHISQTKWSRKNIYNAHCDKGEIAKISPWLVLMFESVKLKRDQNQAKLAIMASYSWNGELVGQWWLEEEEGKLQSGDKEWRVEEKKDLLC